MKANGKYMSVIYGYSDTPHKLHVLRLNGIKYEFIYKKDCYDGQLLIGIPRPELKWQRKVVYSMLSRLDRRVGEWA